MSRDVVNIRVRCRGETTLEVKFQDAETVAEFKARVFGGMVEEGQKCRLIASGRELQDAKEMGFYRLQEDVCLHMMISGRVSAGRAAESSSATAPASSEASPAESSAAPVPAAGSRPPAAAGEGAGFAILGTLTLGMLIAAWAVRTAFPELFSSVATALLLLLTWLQLALTLPLLKKAVVTALGACSCWWRPPPGGSTPLSPSPPRVHARRRQ